MDRLEGKFGLVTSLEQYSWSRMERWWERAFLRALNGSLKPAYRDAATAVPDRAKDVFVTDEELISDDLSRGHLLMASYVLAASRVLSANGLPADEVLQVVQSALVGPGSRAARWAVSGSLFFSGDALATLRKSSRARISDTYGDWFDVGEEDERDAYVSIVRRCGFADFFRRHGEPRLTSAFCSWDLVWTTAIDPRRHGIRFERPDTIAGGAEACRFEFRRTARG